MEELTRTANAQLATSVLSLVVLDAVERLGLFPAACAGHSLGEYTALVASGALSFDDGTRLVVERGEAMQAAADERPGTMAALLGIADDDAEAACQRAEDEVWVANYNAPGQVVIAGTVDGVAAGRRAGQGARRPQGAAHPGLGRLPHPADAAGPGPPAEGARRGRVPLPRGPGGGQRRRPGPHRPGRVARPAVGPAVQPGPVAPDPRDARRPGRHRPRRARARRGAHRAGPAHHPRRPGAGGRRARRPRHADGHGGRHRGLDGLGPAHQGEHLYTSERVVVSPARRGLRARGGAGRPGEHRPGRGHRRPGQRRRRRARVASWPWATGWARSGSTDVRTPFEGILVRWLAVRGERVVEGQPVAWIRTPGSAS